MVVEGVSGEIATPAFIFRRWIESMRDNGLADMGGQRVCSRCGRRLPTGCFQMKAIESTTRVGDIIDPLRDEMRTTVHERRRMDTFSG
jgi:predicted DNA-binding protein (UPF0278 family)